MTFKFLQSDHQKLAELLYRLQLGFERDGDCALIFQQLDRFWALLAMHIRAEHLWLFPAILNADHQAFGQQGMASYEKAESVIARLRLDHNFFMDELAEAVKTFREILAEPLASQKLSTKVLSIKDRVNAVASRLELHNAVEEGEVYEWPTLILTSVQLDDLNEAIKRELNNLPARLRAS